MNINYSIIIPHKNIPELLQRCLDSIPLRDDVQVIVVDDNSDKVDFDNFPHWKGQHYEFYLTKEGRGAGYARNVGLDHANGKWLLFADADDFFNYCLDSILNEYINDDSDLIFFAYSSQDSETYTNDFRGDAYNSLIKKYISAEPMALEFLRYKNEAPHGKLVKRSLITDHNISFQETKICNDVKFSYTTGFYAKNIKVDKRAIYCLTYRPSSITSTITEPKLIDWMRVYAERDIFLANNHVELPSQFYNCYLGMLIDLFQQGNNILYRKCLKILSEYEIDITMINNIVKNNLDKKRKEKDSLDFYFNSANELLTGRRLFGHPLKIVIRILLKIKSFWQ